MNIPIEQFKIIVGKRKLALAMWASWLITTQATDLVEVVAVLIIAVVGIGCLTIVDLREIKPPSRPTQNILQKELQP